MLAKSDIPRIENNIRCARIWESAAEQMELDSRKACEIMAKNMVRFSCMCIGAFLVIVGSSVLTGFLFHLGMELKGSSVLIAIFVLHMLSAFLFLFCHYTFYNARNAQIEYLLNRRLNRYAREIMSRGSPTASSLSAVMASVRQLKETNFETF